MSEPQGSSEPQFNLDSFLESLGEGAPTGLSEDQRFHNSTMLVLTAAEKLKAGGSDLGEFREKSLARLRELFPDQKDRLTEIVDKSDLLSEKPPKHNQT